MKMKKVSVVRIYLTEGEHHFQQLLNYLHDEAGVLGVTAFRGIAGFGQSGKMHSSTLIDLSLDLPLVLEFFDLPEKISEILDHLQPQLNPGHVLTWTAEMNIQD